MSIKLPGVNWFNLSSDSHPSGRPSLSMILLSDPNLRTVLLVALIIFSSKLLWTVSEISSLPPRAP